MSQEELKKFSITKMKNVFLPCKIQRFTVLRSPHVDKKARDQFEKITHNRLIEIYLPYTNTNSLRQMYELTQVLQRIAVGVSLIYKFHVNNN